MSEGRLRARLRRLEADVGPIHPAVPAWEQAAWEELGKTLSPEHEQVLQSEMDAVYAWLDAPGDALPKTPLWDELTRRVKENDPSLGGRKGPLALPPQVAEVYINEPEAQHLYQRCNDCAYAVPAIWEYSSDSPRWRILFPNCPLCGGSVGEGG